MRDSVKTWITKYCKKHRIMIKELPENYIPQSWRNDNRPFPYSDKITRAFNFINKFEKDKDQEDLMDKKKEKILLILVEMFIADKKCKTIGDRADVMEKAYVKIDNLINSVKVTEREGMNNSCDNCWFFHDNDCKKMSIQSFSGSVKLGTGFYCSCWSKK